MRVVGGPGMWQQKWVGLLIVWKIKVDKTGHFSTHSEYSYIMGKSYVEWTGPLLNFFRGHFQTLEPSNLLQFSWLGSMVPETISATE